MKYKQFLLLSVLLASPILAFADVKTESSSTPKVLHSDQNVQQELVEKDVIHLHNEGAISKEDAERLIKNLPGEESPRTNSSLKTNSKIIKSEKKIIMRKKCI